VPVELTTATGRKTPGTSDRAARKARRKFLRFFPGGFRDETYIDWERDYKSVAHRQWLDVLDQPKFKKLLDEGRFDQAAAAAVRIESRTNLLFSFEKMALRDAIKGPGAEMFAQGLNDWLHGPDDPQRKFERWVEVVASLPRRQTRVLTWPLVTVFGFIAQPDTHLFLKPMVTRTAARAYGFDFHYTSRPNWATYESLLQFARTVKRDLRDLKPRDMIDLQSFIWVQGSDEY
jgi:hypothetical protein